MVVNFADLFSQARRFQLQGQLTEAIAAYRDIASLATEAHETAHYANALLGAGQSASLAISERNSSYYRDALELLAQALPKAILLGDKIMQGRIYHQMALAAAVASDPATAAVFFQKSLEQLEQSEHAEAELGAVYASLGAHFGRMGQLEGGQTMLQKSLDLLKKAPLAGGAQAKVRSELAVIHLRRNELEVAGEWAEEALSWFKADHGPDRYSYKICYLTGLLVLILQKQGEAEKKIRRYQIQYNRLLKTLELVAAEAIRAELGRLEKTV
jgi:tetratricopeptide (TPR) repeat protein